MEARSYEPAVEPADVAEVSEVESLKATPTVQTSAGDASEEPVVQATAKPAPAEAHTSAELLEVITGSSVDAPLCSRGMKMRRAGSCLVCEITAALAAAAEVQMGRARVIGPHSSRVELVIAAWTT